MQRVCFACAATGAEQKIVRRVSRFGCIPSFLCFFFIFVNLFTVHIP